MPKFVILLFVTLSFPFLLSTSCNNSAKSNQLGQAVYQKYCFACHGADGKLKLNDAPDLTTSTLPKSEVIQQIKKGKGMMQAYEKMLSPDEIEAVTTYIMNFRK